jgi:hypothetical protein
LSGNCLSSTSLRSPVCLGCHHLHIWFRSWLHNRGSQGREFRVNSVADSDFDSGPSQSPALSHSRFLVGPRIEIIDSGVNSDVVLPLEEEQRFCFDSRSILASESGSELISESPQNQHWINNSHFPY